MKKSPVENVIKNRIAHLTEDIHDVQQTLNILVWERNAFLEVAAKRKPARTPVHRWMRDAKRALAIWLLKS